MPKIQFANLPRPLWQHLLQRVDERKISLADLAALQTWARSGPDAPAGDWYKDFGSFFLCGTGQLPKTVLLNEMKPYGTRIE